MSTLPQQVQKPVHVLMMPHDVIANGVRCDVGPCRWETGKPFVLKDLSMKIKKGTRTLLIGANGAGKSSMLSENPRPRDALPIASKPWRGCSPRQHLQWRHLAADFCALQGSWQASTSTHRAKCACSDGEPLQPPPALSREGEATRSGSDLVRSFAQRLRRVHAQHGDALTEWY